MTVKVTVDNLAKVIASINALVKKEVLVGIPSGTTERKEDEQTPVNNAQLGYIHEYGSPANNIPARPFLIPGVNKAKNKIESQLKTAAKAALNRDLKTIEKSLDNAGLSAQNSVRTEINSGDFQELALSTLKARARKGRKGAQAEIDSRAEGNLPSNENARPLIDTGQLRNSITYVVRGKK